MEQIVETDDLQQKWVNQIFLSFSIFLICSLRLKEYNQKSNDIEQSLARLAEIQNWWELQVY